MAEKNATPPRKRPNAEEFTMGNGGVVWFCLQNRWLFIHLKMVVCLQKWCFLLLERDVKGGFNIIRLAKWSDHGGCIQGLPRTFTRANQTLLITTHDYIEA